MSPSPRLLLPPGGAYASPMLRAPLRPSGLLALAVWSSAAAFAQEAQPQQADDPTGPPPDPIEVLGADAFPPDSGPLDAGDKGAVGTGELVRLGDLLRGDAEPTAKTQLDARVEQNTFYANTPVVGADFEWPEPSVLDLDVWNISGHIGGEQLSRTAISDNPGRLETRRILLGAGLRRPTSDGGLLLAEWNFESTHYRFDNAVDVISNSTQPIEDIVENRLGLHYQDAPERSFSLAGSFELALGSEPDAELADSMTVAGAVAGTWRPDPERPLGITVGAWATSELAEDVNVLPILGVEWEIDDRTRLGTSLRAARDFRPGLHQSAPGLILERDLGSATSAFLRARYRERHTRLDDLGPLPEGAFRERELQLAIGLDWSPGLEWGPLAGSWASFWVGSNVFRELTWYDSADNEFQTRDVDGGAVFGFAVRLAF